MNAIRRRCGVGVDVLWSCFVVVLCCGGKKVKGEKMSFEERRGSRGLIFCPT